MHLLTSLSRSFEFFERNDLLCASPLKTRATFYATTAIQYEFVWFDSFFVRLSGRCGIRRPDPKDSDNVVLKAGVDPDDLPGVNVTSANKIVFRARTTIARFADAGLFSSIDDKVKNVSFVMGQLNSRIVETSLFVAKR